MKIDSTALLVGFGYVVLLIAFVIGIRHFLRSEIGLAILNILPGLFVAFAIGLIVRMKRPVVDEV